VVPKPVLPPRGLRGAAGKGLAGFVQKPFDIAQALAELRRVLES